MFRSGIRLKLWKMKPIFSLRRRERASSPMPCTSTPSSQNSPPLNSSSKPAIFRKVVLPEPEGPVTATNSPSRTWIEKSRKACVSTMWVRYTLERCDIFSMTGLGNRSREKRGQRSIQNDFLRAIERIRAGDDDAIAFLDTGYQLNGIQTCRADLDRRAFGDAVAHDVSDTASARIHKRATLNHQHIRMLVNQDACDQTLALTQPCGLVIAEAYARDDLAIDHFRRHRRQGAGILFITFHNFRRHADGQIVGEYFRHLQFDFERGQIDHAEQPRAGGNIGLLLHQQLADL